MTYFNGRHHGYNSSKGFIPPIPTTRIYCDKCAAGAIPLDKTQPEGREHWNTGFSWAPEGFLGNNEKCCECGVHV